MKWLKARAWAALVVAGMVGGAGAATPAASGVPGGIAPPKLVVVVLVDGLPQEQLLKNYDLFVPNGLRRLMDKGAWFSDAHQAHAFTVTAVGHATILSGAYPYQTGIIGNDWRDPVTGDVVAYPLDVIGPASDSGTVTCTGSGR